MLAIYNASYTKVGLIYSLDKHPVIPYCYKAMQYSYLSSFREKNAFDFSSKNIIVI